MAQPIADIVLEQGIVYSVKDDKGNFLFTIEHTGMQPSEPYRRCDWWMIHTQPNSPIESAMPAEVGDLADEPGLDAEEMDGWYNFFVPPAITPQRNPFAQFLDRIRKELKDARDAKK